MEIGDLKVTTRENTGKGAARKLRAGGKIPGVFYGPGIESVKVAVDTSALKTAFKKGASMSTMFNLISEGKGIEQLSGAKALLREVQRDPLTHEYLHVDLLKIDLAKTIHLDVPLHFIGKAEGVKMGGMLQEIARKIVVKALPTKIPEYIEVDVSALNIGDSLHIKDITLPDGCETDTSTNYTVVTVLVQKMAKIDEEEEAAAAAAAAAAAVEAPDVAGEKDEEES